MFKKPLSQNLFKNKLYLDDGLLKGAMHYAPIISEIIH